MTEILIDEGLSRINKNRGLTYIFPPTAKESQFHFLPVLVESFLETEIKTKITFGVKFPIHTLS